MARTHTDEQILAAYEQAGTRGGAARLLSMDERNYRRRLQRIQARQAKQGWAPAHDMNHTVPDGYHVRGVSTLYDEDGKPRLQWVKSSIDRERQEALIREAFEAFASELPRENPASPPQGCNADLANVFVVTDYHFGALAWGEETRGDDWDLEIAENLLVDWFTAAIQAAPPARVAIFAELGDYQHYDSHEAVTPTNRHILDTDTRLNKMVRIVIRATRRVIRMLLEKHEQVHVIHAEGNHNMASSVWMREWLAALYERESRVTVDISPDPYYCYEHGETSLFFHHGHLKKMDGIQEVFAAKFRDVFGRTKYSYAHMGHLHHRRVNETNLMVVEQHQTLAAKDAYSSRGGYSAERSAQIITYHKRYGEVGRVRFTPEMVSRAA